VRILARSETVQEPGVAAQPSERPKRTRIAVEQAQVDAPSGEHPLMEAWRSRRRVGDKIVQQLRRNPRALPLDGGEFGQRQRMLLGAVVEQPAACGRLLEKAGGRTEEVQPRAETGLADHEDALLGQLAEALG